MSLSSIKDGLQKPISGIQRFVGRLSEGVMRRGDRGGLGLQILSGAVLLGLLILTLRSGGESGPQISKLWLFLSVGIAAIGFAASFLLRKFTRRTAERPKLVVGIFWCLSLASLTAWLPSSVVEAQLAAESFRASGQPPTTGAYTAQRLLVTGLLLSVPFVSIIYFRLSLMDRYVIHSFLSPFTFCLGSLISIFIVWDLTDNGSHFADKPFSLVVGFYLVQMPSLIMFIMPIVVLLASLSAVSRLSKFNELISMIGAGRSILRLLMPLFGMGLYFSFICLVLKFEWAPNSEGYKEALLSDSTAAARKNSANTDVWAEQRWMHVNQSAKRSWFVGNIPYDLSRDMAKVTIWEVTDDYQPKILWKAERARWTPAKDDDQESVWTLDQVTIYEWKPDRIPRIRKEDQIVMHGWDETPWKVLSSAQNPTYLGMSGLSAFLRANAGQDAALRAPFSTHWWYLFANPASCFIMVLVAAPLGIVYSRKGAMSGVTGAIIIFALMYLLDGTLLSMGQINSLPSFLAAWGTNIVIGTIGLILLWYRSQNRDVKSWRTWFARAT